jgi:hypothetical protein
MIPKMVRLERTPRMERNEPMENTLPKDPMEPIDKIEFFDHRLKIEFSEPILSTEFLFDMTQD